MCVCGGGLLKNTLTYLCCTKYNMCNSDIQKHVSYEKWLKSYKYFVYRLTQNFSGKLWCMKGFFKANKGLFILH